jgi:translation initiation factor 2B subunit (eIF-2B alpha/beta/delta family)
MENKNENQVNIELSEEVANGVYSNLTILTHSHSEVVLDFIQLMPGVPKGKVRSRVIMTPQNAKRLLEALKDNLSKYEQHFGYIDIEGAPQMPPMNFGTPTTEA